MHYGNMQVKQVHKKCIIFSLYEVNEVNKQICFEGHSKFSTFLLWRKWNKCAGTDNINNMYKEERKSRTADVGKNWFSQAQGKPYDLQKKLNTNKAKKATRDLKDTKRTNQSARIKK